MLTLYQCCPTRQEQDSAPAPEPVKQSADDERINIANLLMTEASATKTLESMTPVHLSCPVIYTWPTTTTFLPR